MARVKIPSGKNEPAFINDIKEDGYHVYSLKNAKIPGYYPPELPKYPGVRINDLKVDDVITIRVFFKTGSGKNMRIDGGYVDLEVEHIEDQGVMAVILTVLPESFPLGAGHSIEVYEDEILYRTKSIEH
jgi:hypothetical protein